MNNKNADFRRACAESQGAVRRNAIGPPNPPDGWGGRLLKRQSRWDGECDDGDASITDWNAGVADCKIVINIAILIFI